jgi:MerR family transcriptional regulator, mercuric resistance operon regulatory protein
VRKLTIGRVAAAAGVKVETIRYYQRRGLLEEPKKPLGGYRNYPTEMVKRIRFIKRAQALGFTLEDVAGLLQLNNTDACAQTRDLGAQKLALIEQKLSALAAMRDALSKLVGQCDKQLKSGTCPIIEVLQWDSRPEQSAKESSNLRNPNRKTVFAPSLGIANFRRHEAESKVPKAAKVENC